MRWAPIENLEFAGGLVHLNIAEIKQNGPYADVRWHFSDHFSARVGVQAPDDLTQMWAGVQWTMRESSD